MILQLRLSHHPLLSPKPPIQNPNPNSIHKTPASLSLSTSPPSDSGLRFREKLLYLERDLRIDSSKALSQNPSLRSAPLSSILSVADFLRSFHIHSLDAGRIFSMYPHLLTCDPISDLQPVLCFLLGPARIPFSDIRKSVVRCPRLLVSSVAHQLLPAIRFLRRVGFTGPHRISSQTTVLLVSSVEKTLIPKMEYIQSLGFSYRETTEMVIRSPGLLTFSIENNFKPKVEFLVGEMERDVGELKEFPQYFSFSLEGKIKPRHRLLVEHSLSMKLSEMLKVSDGEFRERVLEMRLSSVGEKL